jgi:predicted nucleotidyltransferase
MWSVGEALQRFIESLELTPGQKDEVSGQHTRVREALRQRLGLKTEFLSGSYSRNTAIRPLHDIDIFIVMGVAGSAPRTPVGSAGGGGVTPDEVLKLVRKALKEAWENKDWGKLQQHSVQIEFTKSGISFDLVPAYELPSQEGYLIAERDTGQWIRTNPRKHAELSTLANERAGKKLKPLLKAVKHWKREHATGLLRSFHLEVMSYEAFPTPPAGYLEGLETLFSYLAQRVLRPCLDPAGLGPHVDARMSSGQREAARNLLQGAAREVRLASAERTTNPEQAHARLKKLFGEEYRYR